MDIAGSYIHSVIVLGNICIVFVQCLLKVKDQAWLALVDSWEVEGMLDSDFTVEVAIKFHVHGGWMNYYPENGEFWPTEQMQELLAKKPQWVEELVKLAVLDSLDAPSSEHEGSVVNRKYAVVKLLFAHLPQFIQMATGGLDRFREMTLKTNFGLWPVIDDVRFESVTPTERVHPLDRSRRE